MNTCYRNTLLVTLVTASMVTACAQTAPVSRTNIVVDELKACQDLIARRTLEVEVQEKVPAFSSKALPTWATPASLPDLYGSAKFPPATLKQAYGRSWIYRVPTAVVGRTWDSIGDKEVLIEVVNLPTNISVLGVNKDGTIKWKPVVPDSPAP